MSLDLTPVIHSGSQVIESYGGGRFCIGGVFHNGSVSVFSDKTVSWPITLANQISLVSINKEILISEAIEILLIGCGKVLIPPPKTLRSSLKEQKLILEWMTTDAACRTFNILLAEERSVAAALIAVD
jgi:uncharacterized protein